MQILRQLPFRDSAFTVEVAGETVPIRAYQIVVWVSVSPGEALARGAPTFPAILDTGHSHNFSIQEGQLTRWAGASLEDFPKKGAILVNRQQVPLREARVWIHRNRPGSAELLPRPFRLELPEGVSVYPDGAPAAPRLPLLGLRGLVRNRLRLVVSGMSVSLQEERPRGGKR